MKAQSKYQVNAIISYQCPVCQAIYKTRKEASDCLDRGIPKPRLKVGDIVAPVWSSFGWFDGDSKWVVNLEDLGKLCPKYQEEIDEFLAKELKDTDASKPFEHKEYPSHACKDTRCFHGHLMLRFYYVVTAIDFDERDDHRVRYHLFTKAMSGRQGYSNGYTFDSGHVLVEKVSHPPKSLVKESESFLKKKSEVLLG